MRRQYPQGSLHSRHVVRQHGHVPRHRRMPNELTHWLLIRCRSRLLFHQGITALMAAEDAAQISSRVFQQGFLASDSLGFGDFFDLGLDDMGKIHMNKTIVALILCYC